MGVFCVFGLRHVQLHYIVLLDKTLYSCSLSFHPEMDTGQFIAGSSPAMNFMKHSVHVSIGFTCI